MHDATSGLAALGIGEDLDVLSDVLRSVRLTGAMYFLVEASTPWISRAPAASAFAAAVLPRAQHLISYHVVTAGSCWGGLEGRAPERLEAEFALCELRERSAGGQETLLRLSELMFIETVRRYLESLPDAHAGWLAGLRDPLVARALSRLHRQPARAWTLDTLAAESGASRSVLAERFAERLGQPPMHYLTAWRMQLATHLLADPAARVKRIADAVGYESEAAFSRAFKKIVGAAPAKWRDGERPA